VPWSGEESSAGDTPSVSCESSVAGESGEASQWASEMGGPSFNEVRSRYSFPSEERSALQKSDSTITIGELDNPVPSVPLALSVAGSPTVWRTRMSFSPERLIALLV
jgi:hypothetical protein